MSFDAEISDALADLASEAGRYVLLVRGAVSRAILATPATTRAEVRLSDDARLEMSERDYIVSAADYRFDAAAEEPREGDVLRDLGRSYELHRRGDDVPCWDWSDRGHTHYRLRTRDLGPCP